MIRVVIFDCNALCHAAKFSTKGLSFRGHKTGVMFGFLKTIMKLQETLRGDVIIFAWDSDKRVVSFRKEAYPDYKADRPKKLDEKTKLLNEIAIPQFPIIKEIMLPKLGFDNIFCLPRLEADDIIGAFSLLYSDCSPEPDQYEVVIVSRDGDMFQCLRPNVMMYDPIGKKFITDDSFENTWGIPAKDWVMVKALAGCSTDNVAGVRGVAEKTAVKFLTGALPDGVISRRICANEEMVLNNLKLVQLPHEKTPNLAINGMDLKISTERFIDVCECYGFKSLLNAKTFHRWMDLFGRL